MNDEQRKEVIQGLNNTARDLEHLALKDTDARDRWSIEYMRDRVLDGLKLIYEQENIIKALMGDYGDSCDVKNQGCDGNG